MSTEETSAPKSASAPEPTRPLPPLLALALATPKPARRGWQSALGPAFIGLFLWVAFFDQIPREALGRAGVLWGVLGAGLGGVLAYQFLYYAPALWGWRTGQPLAVVATSTFGVSGATWVPGLLVTLAQPVWLAIAVWYATDFALEALSTLRLIEPAALKPVPLFGLTLPAPLFLTTTLFWGLAAAMAGRYIERVIAALMNVYPVVPAFLLGLVVMLSFRGLPNYPSPDTSLIPAAPQFVALLATAQMVFGFFATAGLASADWGAVTRDERDVKAGGWVGVALSSWVIATLAILAVAGVVGLRAGPKGVDPAALTPDALTFRAALPGLGNAKLVAFIELIFALTSLAPACYAGSLFGSRMFALRPKTSQTMWTLLAVAVAWAFTALGLVARLDHVFGLLGAVLAPAAGAIAADYHRSKGRWPGARRGVNFAGMTAWVCGVVVGLIPYLGRLMHVDRLEDVRPAAVFAFLAAFVVYRVMAACGAESGPDPRPELAFKPLVNDDPAVLSA